MKKITSILVMAMVLLFASCQKETATAEVGTWTLGANTYKVGYSIKTQTSGGQTLFIFSDVVITGANTAANTVALTFVTAPTASGTYQLVSAASGNITGNQVQISAGNQSAAYAYIGAAVNVDVTVSGGKVKLVIPQLSMKGTGGQADANFTATLSEQ